MKQNWDDEITMKDGVQNWVEMNNRKEWGIGGMGEVPSF